MDPKILIPVGVVAAMGLICGIILAVASKLMAVKEDKLVKALRDCLPGANCGACGYTGCDSYAEALSTGEKTNLCVPGAGTVAKKIADVLGVEAQSVVEMVAVVSCNGHCNATGPKQEYVGVQNCAAASLIYGGTGKCVFGCLAYGDCAAVCPNGAICIGDDVARIDVSKCTGCGMCAKACPKHLITLMPEVRKTMIMCSNKEKGAVARKKCSNSCIACKKCEKNCPNDAIHVVNNLAVMDFDKCTDCGICASVCPTKIIHKRDVPGMHRVIGGVQ